MLEIQVKIVYTKSKLNYNMNECSLLMKTISWYCSIQKIGVIVIDFDIAVCMLKGLIVNMFLTIMMDK